VQPERDVVRVCPRGEIDIDTVGAVRSQLDELVGAGFTRVVLDLRDTTFLDSTGLRLSERLPFVDPAALPRVQPKNAA
jgi:anti-anti-sigma factor